MKGTKVFETGNKFGNMNTHARFYPKEMPTAERGEILLERRMRAGYEKSY